MVSILLWFIAIHKLLQIIYKHDIKIWIAFFSVTQRSQDRLLRTCQIHWGAWWVTWKKKMFVKVTVWKQRLFRTQYIEVIVSQEWWSYFQREKEKETGKTQCNAVMICVSACVVSYNKSVSCKQFMRLADSCTITCCVFSLYVTIGLGQYVLCVFIEVEVVNDSHLFPFESQFHLPWINTHILYPSRPIDYILSPAICLTHK